jgi:hypothetical protein
LVSSLSLVTLSSRHARATADKDQAEKDNIERLHNRAKLASEAISTAAANGIVAGLAASSRDGRGKSSAKNSVSSNAAGNADKGLVDSSGAAMGGVAFSLAFTFQVPTISVSLTVEKPVRREFFNLQIQGVSGCLRATSNARSLELEVGDLQLDSYSETAMHPVLLYSRKRYKPDGNGSGSGDGNGSGDARDDRSRGGGDDGENPEPLLKFTIVEEYTTTGTAHYK